MSKPDGRRRAFPSPLVVLLSAVWALQLAMLVPLLATVAVTLAALVVHVARRRTRHPR